MALASDLPSMDLGIICELAERPQWVVWKEAPTPDGKKLRKEPLDPFGGHRASVTNPAKWGTIEEATKYALTTDVNGIGFVLTGLEGYTVIDLDKVIGDDGRIEPWASDVVERFNTYTEISPSGTGLHIWCRGRPPGPRCRTKNIEMYANKRYITVTGRMIESCESDEIEERQELIDQLYEDAFETVPVHGDPPWQEKAAPGERDTQVPEKDEHGFPLPLHQEWTQQEAMHFCQKVLRDGRPGVPHTKLLALNKNDKRFYKIWTKTDGRSIASCADDQSRWDLAIANQIFSVAMDLTWHDVVALLITFREQYDPDPAKLLRADYWARTISRASSRAAQRNEKEEEKVKDDIQIHALEDVQAKIDDDKTASYEIKNVLDDLCSIVGIPKILKITRAKRKNNHLFTLHFGQEDHDKIEGDVSILTGQAKFRAAINSQFLVNIKPMTVKKWGNIVGLILRAVEDEELLPSVEESGETIEWLQGYLASVPRPPEFGTETYLQDGPWWFNGRLIMKLASLEAFLRRVHRLSPSRTDLARRLRMIEVRHQNRSYRSGARVSSLSSYVIPDAYNFHDVANNVPRSIEMIDGEENEEKNKV